MADEEKITAEKTSEERKAHLAKLAKQGMGDKFAGEIPEEKPEEEPQEEPEAAPEQEPEEEPEEEQKAEEEPDEEPQEEPEGDDVVETFDQLADRLGWEDETLKNLKLKRKINGQESEVTVSELLETNQTLEAAREELEQAKTKAADIQAEAQKQQQAANEQLGVAARLIEDERKALQRKKDGVDWEKLKVDDPTSYAVKRAEFEDAEKALDGRLAAAREDYQKSQQEMSEANKKKFDEYVGVQQEALYKAMPEWKDDSVAKKEGAEITNYLLKHPSGFNENEIKNAFDHRFWVFAKKAYEFDKMKAEGPAKKKKIAAVPKTMKPGAAKSTDQLKSKKLKTAQALHAQKHSPRSALELLKAKRAAKG
ncbi:hypothetical protein GWO43_15985 [candidate division KSB1 bacterium]|nr:hypothetical protein [candidate division KSB1 bacterium]NIV68732.1 hypothetical protein [Phycisphaerae bacterium]NIS25451.1 hypothetical protein [candidate division KSB1 bacterium]NIT72343.1 hypothetical protein [candidate division KSB1 bacterium]NIU26128.1 hypothetical protein [candidate division KSB1 bacterium]